MILQIGHYFEAIPYQRQRLKTTDRKLLELQFLMLKSLL